MGRKRKDNVIVKINYKDFIDTVVDLVRNYYVKIDKSNNNRNKSLKPLLLYYPFVPNEKKTPEIYLVIKEENNFLYLMTRNGKNVQLLVCHKMHTHINEINTTKNYYEVFPYFFEEGKVYKSPIIAVECSGSINEFIEYNNMIMKDKILNKIISSDYEYE